MKHELVIDHFKSGTGFSAKCSCGERISRCRGCNRSGYAYGLAAAQERFDNHLAALRSKEEQ